MSVVKPLRGAKELQRNLAKIIAENPKKARGAVYRWLERTMTLSKREYTPVHDGILRASGHVVMEPAPAIKGTMGYGGPAGIGNLGETNKSAVGYAIVQHEEMDFHHEVGGPKYLQWPVEERIPTALEEIAEDIHLEKGK